MNVGLMQVSSRNSPTNCGAQLSHQITYIYKCIKKNMTSVHIIMTFTHLVQEAGGGSWCGTFNSFLSTQVVKELACLWKYATRTKL